METSDENVNSKNSSGITPSSPELARGHWVLTVTNVLFQTDFWVIDSLMTMCDNDEAASCANK